MNTNNSPKSDVLFTESPVSWNTRYVAPEGFECQLTLRGESGQEVLEKAHAAINYLLANGCTPSVRNHASGNGVSTNGTESEESHAHPVDNPNGGNGHDRSFCPIHQCQMKKWEKDGRVWYSHKAGDAWCSGKAKR